MPTYGWHATVTDTGSGDSYSQTGTVTAADERDAESQVRGYIAAKRTHQERVEVNVRAH